MPTTTFPNGQQLVSSALTPQQMSTLFQTAAIQMLGINAVTDPLAYSKVRIDWQTTGAPRFLVTDDKCFIQAVELDEEYGKIRDFVWPYNDTVSVAQTSYYTRVWSVTFTHYGPNSFDNARTIRSAVLLDFVHDLLALSNVYLIPDTPAPKRVPYELNSQWWERTDLRLRFNEFVTETIVVPSGASVEIIVNNSTGVVADFTVT